MSENEQIERAGQAMADAIAALPLPEYETQAAQVFDAADVLPVDHVDPATAIDALVGLWPSLSAATKRRILEMARRG